MSQRVSDSTRNVGEEIDREIREEIEQVEREQEQPSRSWVYRRLRSQGLV
jgi:hypothetical protein